MRRHRHQLWEIMRWHFISLMRFDSSDTLHLVASQAGGRVTRVPTTYGSIRRSVNTSRAHNTDLWRDRVRGRAEVFYFCSPPIPAVLSNQGPIHIYIRTFCNTRMEVPGATESDICVGFFLYVLFRFFWVLQVELKKGDFIHVWMGFYSS